MKLATNLLTAALAMATGRSPPATKIDGLYHVDGAGSFTHSMNLSFIDGFPRELQKSDYTVHDKASNRHAKFNHHFSPDDVSVADGYLDLLVPGGQTRNPIHCAEVSTREQHMLHASVRTVAIFSPVPGTVNANFFYFNDSQEIDTEYLTDPDSQSNPGNGSQPLMYTNQATNGDPADATHANVQSPEDRTTVAHEYRTDWLEGKSVFYVDGVHVKTLAHNVPTIPGPWLWNNWCNGDPGFSVGPPKLDNHFRIQSMVLYYNVSTSG